MRRPLRMAEERHLVPVDADGVPSRGGSRNREISCKPEQRQLVRGSLQRVPPRGVWIQEIEEQSFGGFRRIASPWPVFDLIDAEHRKRHGVQSRDLRQDARNLVPHMTAER